MRRKSTLALLACLGLCTLPALAGDSIDGLARTCNNCHGVDGVSAGGSMPSIGGQSEAYLKNIMLEWKSGKRSAATMNRLVGGLSDDEIAGLAKYFASKSWAPQPQQASADEMAKGKEATDSCSSCHGDTGGQPDDASKEPMLNGQAAKYMELELMKYRADGFNMPYQKMTKAARKMKESDVDVAARFYGAQSK